MERLANGQFKAKQNIDAVTIKIDAETKMELCAAVSERKHEMNDLFTADTLRLMATERNCDDYAFLANLVAFIMQADNGRRRQYSTSEVLDYVSNIKVG